MTDSGVASNPTGGAEARRRYTQPALHENSDGSGSWRRTTCGGRGSG